MQKIDWSKAVSHDDVVTIEDRLKGISILMYGLSSFSEHSSSDNLPQAYECVAILLNKTVKDLGVMRDGVDYMQDLIRK